MPPSWTCESGSIPFGWSYEIILAENGSRDGTIRIADELSRKYPEVRYVSAGEPNYGGALRKGIRLARGPVRPVRRDRPL